MKSWIMVSIAALVFSTAAFAAEHEGKAPGPCKKIVEACEAAGFVKGEAKKGYGLWLDCVDPIMQGTTTVPGATKPLPSVDPKIVSECKAKNPKFGSGKVGTKTK